MGMQQTVSEELKLHVCVCMRACVFVCARTHTAHMPGGGAGISGFAVKFTCFSFKKKNCQLGCISFGYFPFCVLL